MAVLHLNISSLSSHINELKLLLPSFNLNFDIIYITESRITESNLPTSNIHIPGYNTEQTPTESSAGGTLIYISQKRSYKNRPDLEIYHPKHLESIFIEILLPDYVKTLKRDFSKFHSDNFIRDLKSVNWSVAT